MLQDLNPEFQQRVAAWLRTNLPPEWRTDNPGLFRAEEHYTEVRRQWTRRMNAGGLLGVSWPGEHGGASLGMAEELILAEELARACAPEPLNKNALNYIGRAFMLFANREQQVRYLPRMRTGEDLWCQCFSEPDAGSDLAALRTRAQRQGDTWIIDGQKTWISLAPYATYGLVLTLTGPSNSRHRGLTVFIVPMDLPGVTVRPVRQATGFRQDFAEVYFDAVAVPDSLRVGEVNSGWKVAIGCLDYERGLNYAFRSLKMLEEARALGAAAAGDRELTALSDDVLAVAAFVRHLSVRWADGVEPGSASSVLKLLWSETHQRVLAARLAAAGSGLDPEGGDAAWSAAIHEWMAGQPETIYAGTSEIQRGVIGERLLGLPRES